jgi:hypothetical protein
MYFALRKEPLRTNQDRIIVSGEKLSCIVRQMPAYTEAFLETILAELRANKSFQAQR